MAAKETIAMVGASGKTAETLAIRLAAAGYRLLLTPQASASVPTLRETIQRLAPDADIEWSECPKTGCWEADVIMLSMQPEAESEMASRIREVATQKPVVHISDTAATKDESLQQLQQTLPHSHIATLWLDDSSVTAHLSCADADARRLILDILAHAGFRAAVN